MRKKLPFLAATAASLLLLVVGLSCRDNPIGPRYPGKVSLSIAPSATSAGSQAALPINLIRLTATEAGEGARVLAQSETTVDPNATEWSLEFNVPVKSRSESILLSVELLNQASGGGAAAVQWSALAGPLDIEAGRTSQVSNLTLGCGPLTNRGIAAVSITTQPPAQIVEGSDVTLAATAEGGGSAAAVFIWSSLDAAVATVDPAGNVHTLRDGAARVVACAGTHSDTIPLTVVQRPAAIVVTPSGTVTLTSIDAEATFTAQVNDPRGAAVPGATVQWASGDATIATHVGNGRFRAVTNGQTTAIATIAGVQGVQGTGNITVAQAPASVDITQPSVNLATVGSTATLGVTVRDATQHAIPGATVTWLSRNTAVATVSPTGTVTAVAIGATRVVATAAPNVADSIDVTVDRPRVSLALRGVDKVSLGRSAVVDVTLNQPAPAGGVTITIASNAQSILNIDAPNPITIAAGGTTGSVTVNGNAEGTAQLTATASAVYDPGTLSVAVELRVLSLQSPFSVPFGQTAQLPIQLARPAPAGGLSVAVTTSDAAIVGVNTPTVTVPAGAISANATLAGVKPGTATISVSNALYTGANSNVTSAASLNIVGTAASLNESFGTTIQIRFESNGVPVPAPAPGVAINLVAIDPGCVDVQPTATIATGLTDITVPVSWADVKPTPCSSLIRATATDIAPDSVTANVAIRPVVNVGGTTIGLGLQRQMSGSLGASNHGGTVVHLVSPDPARFLLSPDATTPGAATLDIPLLSGNIFFNYYVQSIEGQQTGAITVTASAPGFTADTAQFSIVQPALELQGITTQYATLDPDDAFFVRIGIPQNFVPPALPSFLSEVQSIRVGGQAVTATVRSGNPAAGTLFANGSPTASADVVIQPGQSNSPTTVTTGGVAFRPVAAGTTSVAASIPGYVSTSAATISITMVTPGISIGNVSVGSGLMLAHAGQLLASNHGGAVVHIASRDPSRVLVSKDDATPGTASVDVSLTNGSTLFSFYVHGVEGVTGVVTLDVTEPRFNAATAVITEVQPAFDVQNLVRSTNTLAADNPFFVRIGIPGGGAAPTFLQQVQQLRAGSQSLTVSLVSRTPAVGTLITTNAPSPGAANVTVQIAERASNSGTIVSQGGVAFHPVGGGTTTIRTSIPGFIGLVNAFNGDSIDVTVSGPTMSVFTSRVGSGLMTGASGNLSTPAPAGGVVVHLTSATPGTLLLAANSTTLPNANGTLDVTVPVGQQTFSFIIQGMEGKTGDVSVTATASGFAAGNGTMSVVQPFFDVQGLTTTPTTFDADDPFVVRVGVPFASNTQLQDVQPVRFGAQPLTVSFVNKVPSIGQLKPSTDAGATSTTQITPGQFQSPGSVTAGGVAFDPILNGTTTIKTSIPGFAGITSTTTGDSIDVTVSPPKLNVSNVRVGSGLEEFTTVSLTGNAHGPLTLHITSSQPNVALVALNGTTVGLVSVDTTIGANVFNVSFVVQGVAGATGVPTITVTADGYTQGIGTAAVVQPAISIGSLQPNPLANAPDNLFVVNTGIANSQGTDLDFFQRVSPAAGPLTVTITSSAPTVGAVKTNTQPGPGSITLQAQPGQFSTPPNQQSGGAVFDALTAGETIVEATAAGFTTTQSPALNTGAKIRVTVRPP